LRALAPNWLAVIPSRPKSHNLCAEVLDGEIEDEIAAEMQKIFNTAEPLARKDSISDAVLRLGLLAFRAGFRAGEQQQRK
jgi:hypothetical protein